MKVFAHRGFSHLYPEATRAAYEGALLVGADGFECDVRLTKDKVPVCFHDRTAKRITGISKAISRMTYSELSELTEVMRLEELIEFARREGKELLIETKHPTVTGGAIERAVLQLIKGRDVKATPMSFSILAVWRLLRGWGDVAYVISKRWRLLYIPTEKVAVDIELFTKSRWARKRLAKKIIYLWTVNEKRHIRKLHEWGVAGVITDRPDLPFRLG